MAFGGKLGAIMTLKVKGWEIVLALGYTRLLYGPAPRCYAFAALAFLMPSLIARRCAALNFLPRSLLTRAANGLWPFVLSALIAALIWDSFVSALPNSSSSCPSSFLSIFNTSMFVVPPIRGVLHGLILNPPA